MAAIAFKRRYFIYLGFGLLLIVGNYWLPHSHPRNGSTNGAVTPMAEHINQVHGFQIDDATAASAKSYLVVEKEKDGFIGVQLTSKGEMILDATDQQVLGLNGSRKIEMSLEEYNQFLEKLHGLLQLKGMTSPGGN